MLRVNDVYSSGDISYRILKIYPDQLVVIQLHDDTVFPKVLNRDEFVAQIEDFELSLIADPYFDIEFIEPEKGSVYQIKRDENYALIADLVQHTHFYVPKIRAILIKDIQQKFGTSKQTIYRLLRRYWQEGQTPNALLPKYYNSGAKGQKRVAKDNKLGRKREFSTGEGAIITHEIEEMFHKAIIKFMLTEKTHTQRYAYRKFQSQYRSLYPNVEEAEIPSFRQFQYFYKREYDHATQVKARTRSIEYNKDIKALRSTVNTNVLGPGARYEIDATIADIYLVSNTDRHMIIGRPTIYFVIDVFSRMITGFYVGLENASYVTSMRALYMAFTDKIEFCNQFGISINSEDWPCVGLPDAILADRGELLGHQIENLEKSFAIRIENTPPFRGDLKPVVESRFKLIQAQFKPFAEGIVLSVKERKKGGKDSRLDATLNLQEFQKIILLSVLQYNRTHHLTTYDREPDMPVNLPLVPLDLWNWGIQNRTGKLRSAPDISLYIALLPRKKATLSDKGIKLFRLIYTCAEFFTAGWLHRKRSVNRPKALEVAYDPSDANKIYVFYEGNSLKFWEAKLSDHSREFQDHSFWEVWQKTKELSKTAKEQDLRSNIAKSDLEDAIEAIIKQASLEKTKDTRTIKEKVSNIKANREHSQKKERREYSNNLSQQFNEKEKPNLSPVKHNIIPMHSNEAQSHDETLDDLKLKYPHYDELSLYDDNDDSEE